MRSFGIMMGLMLLATVAMAQRGVNEKIRAEKQKYFNEQMGLNAEQEEEFWTLYDEFQKRQRDIRIEISQNRLSLRKSTLDDKEARNILDTEMELKQSMVDLEKEYLNKYSDVLSPKQIVTMYKAEDEFRRLVMERVGRMRGEGRGNKPGNIPKDDPGPGPGKF